VRKVVLPAAGQGTRLRPLTLALPKEMLPVGRRLVIQHVLEECEAAGLDHVLAVLSRRKLALLDALEPEDAPLDGLQVPRRLVYTTFQRVQAGLGHAILHAEGFAAGESFAVALPDTLVVGAETPILARLARIHQEAGAAVTLAVEEVAPERACRYGILKVSDVGYSVSGGPGPTPNPQLPTPAPGETFQVADVVEKPAPGTEPSRLAISARYVFSPAIFPALRRLTLGPNGELPLTDAIRDLAQQGLPVLGVRLAANERRLDIGSFDSYRDAVRLMEGTELEVAADRNPSARPERPNARTPERRSKAT
jgi:UTP--glucose-1-phosphate uridylyltransferase